MRWGAVVNDIDGGQDLQRGIPADLHGGLQIDGEAEFRLKHHADLAGLFPAGNGGHGIGFEFHEDPWVSYVSRRGTEMVMAPGLCFTIEPMINMGTDEIYQDADNGWTIYTADGMPSAQWEIQVLVTETGYEVLTW